MARRSEDKPTRSSLLTKERWIVRHLLNIAIAFPTAPFANSTCPILFMTVTILGSLHLRPLTRIRMESMKNAGVRAGDYVKVTPTHDVMFGKNVIIIPYEDSIQSVSEEDMAGCDVFDSYIGPTNL